MKGVTGSISGPTTVVFVVTFSFLTSTIKPSYHVKKYVAKNVLMHYYYEHSTNNYLSCTR